MPKDRRVRSLSFEGSRASPYPCSSKNADQCNPKIPSLPVGDDQEWEEARCPICMEHPHNAVLLLCSSSEKGCRSYMCDTSYRHSNCLDQFQKSSASASLAEEAAVPPAVLQGREELISFQQTRFQGRPEANLLCPLCRGEVNGWVVIEPARGFMNSKLRSCSLETCDFNGSYSELRKHARLKHPSVRPTETDPQRQHDWTRLEQERDFQDFLSAHQLESDDEWIEQGILGDHDWMVFEYEGDSEDMFGTFYSETEDDWDISDWLMDSGTFSFPFWGMFFPFDPLFQTSEPGDSRNRQSQDRRSTRSRPSHRMEISESVGSRNYQSRDRRPTRSRDSHRVETSESVGSRTHQSHDSRLTRVSASDCVDEFPANRHGSNSSWRHSQGLQRQPGPNQRQSRPRN